MKRDLLTFLMTMAAMVFVLFLALLYEPKPPQQANAMELFCQHAGKFTKIERIC